MIDLYRWLPPEGVKILLVLFLTFLIGLEREDRLRGPLPSTFLVPSDDGPQPQDSQPVERPPAASLRAAA